MTGSEALPGFSPCLKKSTGFLLRPSPSISSYKSITRLFKLFPHFTKAGHFDSQGKISQTAPSASLLLLGKGLGHSTTQCLFFPAATYRMSFRSWPHAYFLHCLHTHDFVAHPQDEKSSKHLPAFSAGKRAMGPPTQPTHSEPSKVLLGR